MRTVNDMTALFPTEYEIKFIKRNKNAAVADWRNDNINIVVTHCVMKTKICHHGDSHAFVA